LYRRAYAAKEAGLKKGWLRHTIWDALVFGKVAQKVGLDRCRIIITGSAPIAPHVLDFLRIVFSCVVVEGYGQTETCAGSNVVHVDDYSTGHVGGPLPCNEIRLESVPEMNYLVTDTEHAGKPCAGRGEICFHGPNMFNGYYKMPDKTKEAKDDDNWVHSGDIGLWTTKGQLKIIDRKKNIFKLAQGEYIAPEKIENVYGKAPFVAQSFVYGDSYQSVLVAIVVPDFDAMKDWLRTNNISGSHEELCRNDKVKQAVLADMNKVGKEAKFTGLEYAKDVTLIAKPFTPDDLLTPTFKLKRNEAKDYFQDAIDKMYEKVGGVAGKQVKQGSH